MQRSLSRVLRRLVCTSNTAGRIDAVSLPALCSRVRSAADRSNAWAPVLSSVQVGQAGAVPKLSVASSPLSESISTWWFAPAKHDLVHATKRSSCPQDGFFFSADRQGSEKPQQPPLHSASSYGVLCGTEAITEVVLPSVDEMAERGQIIAAPQRTYRPNRLKRKRKHGFLRCRSNLPNHQTWRRSDPTAKLRLCSSQAHAH